MKHSGFQNVVRVLAGAAALVFTWLLPRSDERARNMGGPAVVARFALTDQTRTIRSEADFKMPLIRRALTEGPRRVT